MSKRHDHLIDINDAIPGWVGVADFVGLALAALFLGWLFLTLRVAHQ